MLRQSRASEAVLPAPDLPAHSGGRIARPFSPDPSRLEKGESRSVSKGKETLVLTVLESERLLWAVGSTPSAYTRIVTKRPHYFFGQVLGVDDLEQEQLYEQRDLQLTTDFRDVLGEMVVRHLGNTGVASVFPGYEQPKFRGIVAG